MSKKTLVQWENSALFDALTAILIREFGSIPQVGIVAGQSVASACYELLGLGVGLFKDLDVFISNLNRTKSEAVKPMFEAETPETETLRYNSAIRGSSQLPMPTVKTLSQSDELLIEPLFKSGYQLLLSYQSSQNPLWNIVEISHRSIFQEGIPVSAEELLDGFDINACCIALDMNAQRVVWTEEFESFTFRPALAVTSLITPAHTALRLLRKKQEIPFATLDLPVQMSMLQQARALAVKCQSPQIGYLAGHLMTRHTLSKNMHNLPLLNPYFHIVKTPAHLECTVDDLKEGVTPQMYPKARFTLEEIQYQMNTPLHSQDRMFFWDKRARRLLDTPDEQKMTEALNTLFDNEHAPKDPLWDVYRTVELFSLQTTELDRESLKNVNAAFNLGTSEVGGSLGSAFYLKCAIYLMKIIKNRREVGASQKSDAKRLYLSLQANLQGAECNNDNVSHRMIQRLLLVNPKLAGQYREKWHRSINYLYAKHPQLHNALVERAGAERSSSFFNDLAISAARVKRLDKQRKRFIVGLYESDSSALKTHAFPELYSDDFDGKIEQSITSYLQACQAESFESPQVLLDYLKAGRWLDPEGNTKIRAISNHADFIMLGEQYRHCVGGYYKKAEDMESVIFEAHDNEGNGTVVELSVFLKPAEGTEERCQLILSIRQNYGLDNQRPNEVLTKTFKVGSSIELYWDDLPLSAQNCLRPAFERYEEYRIFRSKKAAA